MVMIRCTGESRASFVWRLVMKPYQALVCLVLLIAAGIVISGIFKQTAVAVVATDMPAVEIEWSNS